MLAELQSSTSGDKNFDSAGNFRRSFDWHINNLRTAPEQGDEDLNDDVLLLRKRMDICNILVEAWAKNWRFDDSVGKQFVDSARWCKMDPGSRCRCRSGLSRTRSSV